MYLLRIVTTVFLALTLLGEIVAVPHTDKRTRGFDVAMIVTNVMALVCMWGIYE